MKTGFLFLAVLIANLLAACSPEEPAAPTSQPLAADPTVEPPMTETQFRVIAYATASIVPEAIPYDRLTHINYSFLIPNGDGSFAHFGNSWKLVNIVDQAHERGVQVLISVGGWGWDEQFETMAADPSSRAAFVANLDAFVQQYDLDGADIDWEYPQQGASAQNFLMLIQELRQVMPDKLLTTAVVSHGTNGEGVPSETFELFDFVNVMTYEGPDHGTMQQFQTGMGYWRERGLEPAKMVLGIPFYAEPNEVIYRKIVEADPSAANRDQTEYHGAVVHYNGRPTVQEKTQLAMQEAGGIMFWTLEHDTLDDLSLLKAIDDVVKGSR